MKLRRFLPLVPVSVALFLLGAMIDKSAIARAAELVAELTPKTLPITNQTTGPTKLLIRIAKAELVVCTNSPDGPISGYIGFITKGGVTNLIEAISAMKPFPTNTLHPILDMKLYFFSGTNCLAVAKIADNLMECEDGLYEDETGVIRGIYAHWVEILDRHSMQVNEEAAKMSESYDKKAVYQTNRSPN